jgi:16S rRNA (adenine1518-N6/adenine1519-N6)-dimethyltransferase
MPQRRERPRLGQNFLVDSTAQTAIVDALGDASNRTVVEIGPGRGALTALLAGRARWLVTIELDRELAGRLREQFADRVSVEVLERDVLGTDFAALRGVDGEKLLVFQFEAVVERAVLMMQREVADRVAAHPGTSDYGVLSATTQMYARVEKLMTLPPTAFSPPPQVHSTVVRLTMAPRFDELGVEAGGFLPFVRSCFAQKRKMLGKNLRNAGYEAGAIAAGFAGCGISSQVRAEAVGLEGMACLFRRLTASR